MAVGKILGFAAAGVLLFILLGIFVSPWFFAGVLIIIASLLIFSETLFPAAAIESLAAKALKATASAAANTAASAHSTPTPPTTVFTTPANTTGGTKITDRLKILSVLLGVVIALYFILGKAGLAPTYNLIIISVPAIISLFVLYPPAFEKSMKALGILALICSGLLVFLILGRFGTHVFLTTGVMVIFMASVFVAWHAKIGIPILLLNLLVFTLLLGPPASIDYPPFNKISYTRMFRAESPLYLAAEQQKVIFEKGIAQIMNAPETIKEGGTSAQQALKRQILIATGEYETGVEAQSSAPLGVFLEKTGVTSPRVTIGTPIDLYSELTAQAFKSDELLEVQLGCYGKTLAGEKIPGSDGEIQPQSTFELAELESYPIDCILDSTKIAKAGQSAAKATLEATFDFSTGAFLKGHFMPQEVIRDYTRQGKQPLTEFGITGKDITATYTAGPLRVGMGLGRQPVPILPNAAFGPTLGITFENNWPQGKFQTFKKLVITAPPGLEIKSIDGQDVTGKCKRTPQKEHSCTFQGEADVVKFFPDKIYTKTLRVQTQGTSADELLGGAPLAIRSFKVDVTYTYQIHTDVDITILPVAKT